MHGARLPGLHAGDFARSLMHILWAVKGGDHAWKTLTVDLPQGRFTVQPIPKGLIESAKLNLKHLKENLEYQKFYEKIKNELSSCSYPTRRKGKKIQDPPDEQHIAFPLQRVFEEFKQSSPFFHYHCQELGFDTEQLRLQLMARKISRYEVLDLLDPQKDLETLSLSLAAHRYSYLEKSVLPKLFIDAPAVLSFTLTDPIARCLGVEQERSRHNSMQPYRLYAIDLRKGET